jgi:ankyrin repeat protein
LEVVKLLLERGANPNQAEPEAPEGGALRDAVGGDHYDIAKLLLEHGANPNASVESSGSCIWAARKHPRMFRLLASYGGVIRFDLACYDGDVSIVGAMLAANPSLDIKEDALQNAAENGHDEVLALIHRFQPETLKRHRLGDPKTPELARWLLERGVDPNRPNWLGITPMHRFAGKGRIDLAEVLLESGAHIDPIDEEYCSTPLGWAARSGREEMVIWLLAKGADLALPKDKPWAAPVEWAKRRGHDDIVSLL